MQQNEGGVAEVRARLDGARPVTDTEPRDGEPDYVVIRRQVPARKGKWRLVPEEVEREPDAT
jgi:hypothetical protein